MTVYEISIDDWTAALDVLAKRNAALWHQVEQLTERRNEAARIIEEKREEIYRLNVELNKIRTEQKVKP
jgi:predicted RNase H-like nuclease (RuvC/YqgF family)